MSPLIPRQVSRYMLSPSPELQYNSLGGLDLKCNEAFGMYLPCLPAIGLVVV
jgi:hypothetical protein